MTNDDQGHRLSFRCHVVDSGDVALVQLLVLVRDQRRGLSALTSDVVIRRLVATSLWVTWHLVGAHSYVAWSFLSGDVALSSSSCDVGACCGRWVGHMMVGGSGGRW